MGHRNYIKFKYRMIFFFIFIIIIIINCNIKLLSVMKNNDQSY